MLIQTATGRQDQEDNYQSVSDCVTSFFVLFFAAALFSFWNLASSVHWFSALFYNLINVLNVKQTCSSSWTDAARGSPSCWRAIIVSSTIAKSYSCIISVLNPAVVQATVDSAVTTGQVPWRCVFSVFRDQTITMTWPFLRLTGNRAGSGFCTELSMQWDFFASPAALL